MPEPLLKVAGLEAWYGESHVLHGVDFEVRKGELITLVGRNGAGKTTTLKSIMGIVGQRSGSVRFSGAELIGRMSDQIARAGIAFCPEERGIFASLDVEETPRLLVYNKADRVPDQARVLAARDGGVAVSSLTRDGFPDLLARVEEMDVALWDEMGAILDAQASTQ